MGRSPACLGTYLCSPVLLPRQERRKKERETHQGETQREVRMEKGPQEASHKWGPCSPQASPITPAGGISNCGARAAQGGAPKEAALLGSCCCSSGPALCVTRGPCSEIPPHPQAELQGAQPELRSTMWGTQVSVPPETGARKRVSFREGKEGKERKEEDGKRKKAPRPAISSTVPKRMADPPCVMPPAHSPPLAAPPLGKAPRIGIHSAWVRSRQAGRLALALQKLP